jgi:hypothetical protein
MAITELRARLMGRVRRGRDPETGEIIVNYQDEQGRWFRKGRDPETGVRARIYPDEDLRDYLLDVDPDTGEEIERHLEEVPPIKRDLLGRRYRMGRNIATGERVRNYL